jgi:hypothetical protein
MSVSSISSSSSTNTSAAAASAAFRANRTFQSALVTLNENIDKFEHQTTWQLDNNTAVTLPAGVSNSSSASTTTATTNTSSPASTIEAGFSGLESNAESSLTDLTPDQQTQLDAENAKLTKEEQRFEGFAAHRGSVDAHQDNQYKGNTTLLGDQINAYEHQVTWQIDHGTAITPPDALKSTTASSATTSAADTSSSSTASTETATSANTSSGSTTSTSTSGTTTPSLSDSIAAGFAALEANASKQLGHLSAQFATQFQQLQQNLVTEQTRFTSFAARREAYRAANPKAQTTSDVTA